MGENSNNKTKKDIFHVIDTPFSIKLELVKSANAWWMDLNKVYRLTTAFSLDSTIREACEFAGITEKQYKYFVKIHPIVPELRNHYTSKLMLTARKTIVERLNTDTKIAWKFLITHDPSISNKTCPLCRKKYESEKRDINFENRITFEN